MRAKPSPSPASTQALPSSSAKSNRPREVSLKAIPATLSRSAKPLPHLPCPKIAPLSKQFHSRRKVSKRLIKHLFRHQVALQLVLAQTVDRGPKILQLQTQSSRRQKISL